MCKIISSHYDILYFRVMVIENPAEGDEAGVAVAMTANKVSMTAGVVGQRAVDTGIEGQGQEVDQEVAIEKVVLMEIETGEGRRIEGEVKEKGKETVAEVMVTGKGREIRIKQGKTKQVLGLRYRTSTSHILQWVLVSITCIFPWVSSCKRK